jgi:EmrB/QacA subfamily drug resistance transporter
LSRRAAILATCCLSLFLVTLDLTIVNVALPAIRRDLNASVAGLAWAVDGYTVVVASLLVLGGSLADRWGRRTMFQRGLAVFTVGSVLCSLAPSVLALVGARMLQAIGGSMLNPVAMAIVVTTFPAPAERARALGVWGATFGLSMAAGPWLGGILVHTLGWRSIFWVHVPMGVLALALSAMLLPARDEAHASASPRPLDWQAQLLLAVGLFALVAAVIDARRAGIVSPFVLGGLLLAAAAAVSLVAWESRHPTPLLDAEVLGAPALRSAMSLAALSFAAFSCFLFVNALYLQEARGLDAEAAGRMTAPVALGLLVSSPRAGRWVAEGRSRRALVTAGASIAAGALLLARVEVTTPTAQLLVAYALFGVGIGHVGAPVNAMAVAGLPPHRAAFAAALASTSRQIGAALGVAMAGALGGEGLAHGAAAARSAHAVYGMTAMAGIAVAMLGSYATGARPLRRDRAIGPAT